MTKKKKVLTAGAAFAVAAAALTPVASVDAAQKRVIELAPMTFTGGEVKLPAKVGSSKITWYKSGIDMKKVNTWQTVKGYAGSKKVPTTIKIKIANYVVGFQQSVAPQEVEVDGKLVLPAKLKANFAVGAYFVDVKWEDAKTDKAGDYEVKGTYTRDGKTITVVAKYSVVDADLKIENVSSSVDQAAEVLSVNADVKNLKDGEKVELVVFAGRDMNAPLPAVQAEVKEGKLTVKSAKLPAGNHSFILRSGEVKTDAVNFTVEAAMVKEVKAINAKQIQVTFNKAIDSSVVESNGTIVDSAFTLAKVSGPAAGVGVIGNGSVAKLSEDKMSVIIDANDRLEGQYVLTLADNKVNTTAGKSVAAYTSGVFGVEDKVAPAVASVSNLSASVVRVKFTEPLASEGSWTFKLADGSNATVVPTFSAGKDYVDLTIDGGVANGAQITATILGASDYATNLISPNPTTINFVKGAKDGVKPTVSSITSVGLNKFEVKFSEKVQNVDVADFKVNGTALVAGTDSVTVDSEDPTKYIVTLATPFNPTLPATSELATIVVNPNATSLITDLSGEQFDGVSRIVEFKKDTVAPKLVKSEVKKENGEEFLFLTFDESVVLSAANALDSLSAKQLKDFVTTSGTIDLDGSADDKLIAVPGDSKSLKVKLADLRFTPTSGSAATLVQGAEYTVTLDGLKDAANNPLAATTIKFVRATDADTAKPVPTVTTFTNDVITLTFDRQLDGASAINKANYSINGLAVENVTLKPNNVVEVTLASGTNQLNGARNFTVSGVKSKDGVVMDNFTTSLNLKENVKPTITKAEFVDLSTIRVTFSESVKATTVAEVNNATPPAAAPVADFALKLDGADFSNVLTEVMAADGNTMTITLGTPVNATQYAKTLTVVPTANFDIEDLNSNKAASFTSVVVSK